MTLVDPLCVGTAWSASDGLVASSKRAVGDRVWWVRRYVCSMSSRRYTNSASALGGRAPGVVQSGLALVHLCAYPSRASATFVRATLRAYWDRLLASGDTASEDISRIIRDAKLI